MSVILSIETSTTVCSTSLSKDGICLLDKHNFEGPSHASLLSVYVQSMLDHAKKHALRPDAIAVSRGPGSYTGLRIGVSTAKGLCMGFDVPLIAIDTLKIMAFAVLQKHNIESNALLCPMIDARRMEVYAAFFDEKTNCVRHTSADIIDSDSYADLLEKHPIYFFGNGAEKCKTTLRHPNAFFIDDIHPLAKDMAWMASEAFEQKKFEDIAYFEPFYLKEFMTTTSKKKLL